MNLYEGQILEITTKQNNESSTAYFQIKKSTKGKLYLSKYSDNDFKPNGYREQKINAENLNTANVEKLFNKDEKIDEQFLKRILYQKFKDKNPESKIEKSWYSEEIKASFKDITDEVNKKREKYKAKIKNSENEQKTTSPLIKEIPQEITEFFKKNKNINLSNEEYSERIFNMTKKLNSIPYYDQNISDFDKKTLKPLLTKYKKTNGTDEELRKVFDQYVFDNNSTKELIKLGLIYKKSLDKNFKGFKKQRTKYIENEREELIEAFNKKKLPFTNKQDEISYIMNPLTNAIYQGFNQLALQINNNLQNINAQHYVDLKNYTKSNPNPSMKIKSHVICLGPNKNGHNTYLIGVPVKPTRKERKAEKLQAKEELRRNIFDAKFKYKNGKLPEFETQLNFVEKQIKLAEPENVKITIDENKKDKNIQEKLQLDIENFFKAALTKEPFTPKSDWNSKDQASELLKIIMEKPEEIVKIANESYQNIAKQIRTNENININTNENIKENTETNIQKNEETKQITKTRKRKG